MKLFRMRKGVRNMQNLVKRHRQPRLLGVFAHPDDETFCAGGTLAKHVAAGWQTMVISATSGQAGQIRDPLVATRRTLGQVREREFYAACQQLGVRHARVLDYMDGTLQDADPHELTGAIVQIIRAFRPDVAIAWPTGWPPPPRGFKAQPSLPEHCRCLLWRQQPYAMPATTSMWNGIHLGRTLLSRTNRAPSSI